MSENPDRPQPDPPPAPVLPLAGIGVTGRPKTSGAAVASLVLGILMCVPVITGGGAILLGSIGIRATRNPHVGGRGLAIAGLILGIISVLGWAGIGAAWVQTRPDRAIVATFIQDLDTGNLTGARAACAPGITTAQLQQASDYVKTGGTFQSYTNSGFNVNWTGGGTATAVITGTANLSGGPRFVTVTLHHPGNGPPMIQTFRIQ